MAENKRLLRIGIMGTARIARKNSRAINNSCTSNCIVTAVASRDSSKAREFVVDNIMPEIKDSVTIYSSYNDLIKSDDVCDAIYIPLPTKLHKEFVIQALKAGKHVLVEKPVATSALEYQELIDTAKTCGKYLQDGTMFVHNPRFGHFLDTIGDEDKFGTVDRINSDFSFRGDEHFFKNDIRCKAGGDPLGCVGDLGWYCIRAAVGIFSFSSPSKSIAKATKVWVVHAETNDEGVPIDVTCLVYFGNRILNFHCSFLYGLRQKLETRGSKSTASMIDFVIPTVGVPTYEIHNMGFNEMEIQSVESNELVECECGPRQETLMWRNFECASRKIDEGNGECGEWKCDDAEYLSNMSFQTQIIVDAIVKSIQLGCVEVNLV